MRFRVPGFITGLAFVLFLLAHPSTWASPSDATPGKPPGDSALFVPAGPERFQCGLYKGYGVLQPAAASTGAPNAPGIGAADAPAVATFTFYAGTTRQYTVKVLKVRPLYLKQFSGKPIEAELLFKRGGRGSNALIAHVVHATHALQKDAQMRPPVQLAGRKCR